MVLTVPGAAPICESVCLALAPLPGVLACLHTLHSSRCRARALLVLQHALRRLPIQQTSHHTARIPADKAAAVLAVLPVWQAAWTAWR